MLRSEDENIEDTYKMELTVLDYSWTCIGHYVVA
jgi:hypothetical protein